MKTVLLKNEDGSTARFIRIPGITKGKGRAMLLHLFATEPKLRYVETNVRRYTVSDIYAGRLGQAI